jgi:hypothetical protein
MMTPNLQQRFDQLLRFATDPKYTVTARENIAAAKEMVDTLYVSDLLSKVDYNEYRALVMTAQLAVSAAELKRARDATDRAVNMFDGARV